MSAKNIVSSPFCPPLLQNASLISDISNAFSKGELDLQAIARNKLKALNKKLDPKTDEAALKNYEKLLRDKELCVVFKAGKEDYYKNTFIGKLTALFNRIFGCSPLKNIDIAIGNIQRQINEVKPKLTQFSPEQLSAVSQLATMVANNSLSCGTTIYLDESIAPTEGLQIGYFTDPEKYRDKAIEKILAMNTPKSLESAKLDATGLSVVQETTNYLESDEHKFHLGLAKTNRLADEKRKLEAEQAEREKTKQTD
ncbi:MAG: hypothetical protein HYX67_08165, partial [Candidatus Melainabacteria bacterium]|nr:hypothetical protein [Candidatus Melainabacteria bacterium]